MMMNFRFNVTSFLRGVILPVMFLISVNEAGADEVRTALQVVSFQKLGENNRFYWKTEVMESPDKQPQVKVSSNTLLPPVKYKGPSTLTLMLHIEGKGYQPVASVNLPASSSRTIVVLIPKLKTTALSFRAIAMRGDLKNFKAGTRRLVNLSNIPLRGEMGANPFKRGAANNVRFGCRSQGMVDVPVLNANAKPLASQPVILEYYGADKKWRILSSTRWFHTPTQRHLIFVFHDPARKNLILRGISDTVAADTRDIAANKASEDEDPEERKKRLEKKKNAPAENPGHR